MKAKFINNIPTFDEMYYILPKEIKEHLDKCKKTPQSIKWHPEGNVLKHIKIVYNRAKKIGDIDYVIAALFHDLGKAYTTSKNKKGDWASHGHEFLSANFVIKYESWIKKIGANFDKVYNIVKEHMRIKLIDKMRPVKQEKLKSNIWFDNISKFSELDDMSNLSNNEIE